MVATYSSASRVSVSKWLFHASKYMPHDIGALPNADNDCHLPSSALAWAMASSL